jgi:hypothetical protein
MRFKTFAAALAAVTLAAAGLAQPVPQTPEFTAAAFRSHVAFLADDLLEGREVGTRGYDLAARYVATRFESLGLKAVTAGGWYQQVPFVEFRLGGTPATLAIGGREFRHGEDVLLTPTPTDAPEAIEAPVVFAGYGLQAPELGIDDYKGLDLRGKIVAVLGGFPKGMRSDIGAHLNADKRRVASERGAVGMIVLRTRAEAARRGWDRLRENPNEPALTWLGEGEEPFAAAPRLRFRATLDMPAAQALFAGARRPLTAILAEADRTGGSPKGFALKPVVRVAQQSRTRRITSPNVLAVLPGSDPALANEYVLLMAHLDGLGVHDREGEDDIHNGAMDNATGIATMIEVARAIANGPNRPRRSILFAAVTAEEKGLLGAQYLARNPVLGDGKVVGVVNLDMPVLLYDFTDVIAFGAEHSTLGPIVARAGEQMGISLADDPLPEQGLFTRSDHYRFVQEGIPSVFLMTGFANGGKEKFTDFLSTHYHRPSDDLKLPIDWAAAAKFARINYLIAREIADAAEAPRWYSDSFFGRSLAPGQAKAERPGGR